VFIDDLADLFFCPFKLPHQSSRESSSSSQPERQNDDNLEMPEMHCHLRGDQPSTTLKPKPVFQKTKIANIVVKAIESMTVSSCFLVSFMDVNSQR
jgi:hypothetical protein